MPIGVEQLRLQDVNLCLTFVRDSESLFVWLGAACCWLGVCKRSFNMGAMFL